MAVEVWGIYLTRMELALAWESPWLRVRYDRLDAVGNIIEYHDAEVAAAVANLSPAGTAATNDIAWHLETVIAPLLFDIEQGRIFTNRLPRPRPGRPGQRGRVIDVAGIVIDRCDFTRRDDWYAIATAYRRLTVDGRPETPGAIFVLSDRDHVQVDQTRLDDVPPAVYNRIRRSLEDLCDLGEAYCLIQEGITGGY